MLNGNYHVEKENIIVDLAEIDGVYEAMAMKVWHEGNMKVAKIFKKTEKAPEHFCRMPFEGCIWFCE